MASESVSGLYSSWREILNERPSVNDIEACYRAILQLSDADLVSFHVFSDAPALLKNSFSHQDSRIRSACCKGGGRYLIRLWSALHEHDIESCFQFENLTDATRKKEDIMDFVLETFTDFSKLLVGSLDPSEAVAAPVDASLTAALSLVIVDLFDSFHGYNYELSLRVDQLCGLSGSHSRDLSTKASSTRRLREQSFVPLVQSVVDHLFQDPILVIQRAHVRASYQYQQTQLINRFFLCCLKTVGNGPGSEDIALEPTSMESKSIFSTASSTDLTATSHQGAFPLPLLLLLTEWIDGLMTHLQTAFRLIERALVLRDILLLSQHPMLRAAVRKSIAPSLVREALFLLNYYEDLAASPESPSYDQLLSWALLGLQWIDIAPAMADVDAQSCQRFVSFCSQWLALAKPLVGSPEQPASPAHIVLHGRLVAEVCLLLLTKTIQFSDTDAQFTTSSSGDISGSELVIEVGTSKFEPTLLKLVLSTTLKSDLLPTNRAHLFTESLVLILCQALFQSLQHLERRLLAAPAFLFAEAATESIGESSSEKKSKEELQEGQAPTAAQLHAARRFLARLSCNDAKDSHAIDCRWDGEGSPSLWRRCEYWTKLPLEQLLEKLAVDEPTASIAAIKTIMREDFDWLLSAFLSLTDDAAYVLQAFVPCFKWTAPNAACALVGLCSYLCETLIDGERIEAQKGASAHSLTSLAACREEVRARVHMLCSILLSLLDNSMKTCSISISNGSIVLGGNNWEMLKLPHMSQAFALIAIYAIPYSFQYSRDKAVLLPRLHFLCYYASFHMYNTLEDQRVLDKLEAGASVGFLGGLTDTEDSLVLDQSGCSQQVLHQLHALELLNVLADIFCKHADVLKVMLPFVLDLQQSLLSSEMDAFFADTGTLFVGDSHLTDPIDVARITANATLKPAALTASNLSDLNTSLSSFTSSPRIHNLNTSPLLKEQVVLFLRRMAALVQEHEDQSNVWTPLLYPDIDEAVARWFRHVHGGNGVEIHSTVLQGKILHKYLQSLSAPSSSLADAMARQLEANGEAKAGLGKSSIAVDLVLTDDEPNGRGQSSLACARRPSLWQTCAKQTRRLRMFADSASLYSQEVGQAESASWTMIPNMTEYCATAGDVAAGHFASPAPRKQAVARLRGSGATNLRWCESLLDVNEVSYTQVSGGQDILTVLAAVTAVDAARRTARLRLRVYNNGTCKIPFFGLHVLLGADDTLPPLSDTVLFSAESLRLPEATGPAASLLAAASLGGAASGEVLSCEYLAPGALAEREVTIALYHFSPIDIHVRVVYPELMQDSSASLEKAGEASAATQNGSLSESARSARPLRFAAATVQHCTAQPYLSHYGSSVAHSTAATKWTAVVSCTPLRIPLMALLLPYGRGNFRLRQRNMAQRGEESSSSLVETFPRETELDVAGIPWAVSRSLFVRLGSRYSHTVRVVGLAPEAGESIAQLVLVSMVAAVSAPGGVGMHFCGTDSLSVRPSHKTAAGIAELLPCVTWEGEEEPHGATLGWSFQTLWGAEVAILLTIDETSSAIPGLFSATLRIRCSESHVLTALLVQLEDFVHGMSGGCLQLQ